MPGAGANSPGTASPVNALSVNASPADAPENYRPPAISKDVFDGLLRDALASAHSQWEARDKAAGASIQVGLTRKQAQALVAKQKEARDADASRLAAKADNERAALMALMGKLSDLPRAEQVRLLRDKLLEGFAVRPYITD